MYVIRQGLSYFCIAFLMVLVIYATGFAKRGLPRTSNLPTLTIHNFRLETAIDLKFSQKLALT